eukprot:2310198-Alexandrium_andersonii.AAC.1
MGDADIENAADFQSTCVRGARRSCVVRVFGRSRDGERGAAVSGRRYGGSPASRACRRSPLRGDS